MPPRCVIYGAMVTTITQASPDRLHQRLFTRQTAPDRLFTRQAQPDRLHHHTGFTITQASPDRLHQTGFLPNRLHHYTGFSPDRLHQNTGCSRQA